MGLEPGQEGGGDLQPDGSSMAELVNVSILLGCKEAKRPGRGSLESRGQGPCS